MVLEIVFPNRQLDFFKAMRLKESIGRRKHHIVISVSFELGLNIFDQSPRRTAAVVANAVEDHHAVPLFVYQLFREVARSVYSFCIARTVSARIRDMESRYLSAVKALPHKHIWYLGVFMSTGAHHNICCHTAVFYNLRKHSAVAERIHVVCGFTYPAEFFVVIELRIERLTGKALSRGHIAVRLNPPAVDGHPASLFDSRFYLLEHIGIDFFDPLIVRRRRASEHKIGIFIEPVECTAESLKHFPAPLLPTPEPDRIKVCVAYKMNFRFI